MGFYDEFDHERRPQKSNSASKWVAVILVSALVGSGTTMAAVPVLVKKELSQQMPASPTASGNYQPSGPVQNVAYKNNTDVVQAVNKVKPAVVGVVNLQKVRDPFNLTPQERQAGVGSGVLFDDKGDIVTNNHVVQDASDVQVVIQDEYLKAKVIGTDPDTDLAVVRVSDLSKVKNIKPAEFGDSDKLQIGEPAIAIGNPLGIRFAQTVTVGVISALKRDIPTQSGLTESYLQTDAAINPGNSGGALCNIEGQVVGINSAKISSSGVEGIGFAIPINSARPIIDQLLQKGKVSRPMLGVKIVDTDQLPPEYQAVIPDSGGVFVQSANTEAQAQGIKRGDVITKIDGKPVKDSSDLRTYLYAHKPGDSVQVTVLRVRDEKTLTIKLQEKSSQ